jgi:hypothetical protein
MHRFVLVTFMFPGVPKMRDLEPIFTTVGDDWIRISTTTWVIWTAKTTAEIYQIVNPHIDVQDSVMLVGINTLDSFGRLPPWVWTWLNSKVPALYNAGPEAANALFLAPPKRT